MTYGDGGDTLPAPPPPPPTPPPGYQSFGVPTPPPRGRRIGLYVGVAVGVFVVVVLLLFVVGTKVGPPSLNTGYTDPQNQWSAKFEGTPSYQSQTVSSAAGEIPVNIAEYSASGVDEFVGTIQAPPGSTFNLQAALNGMASRVNGTVTSSSPTTFQGYDALEGVISTTDQGTAKCMIVHTDSVDYMICAVGTTSTPSDYAPLLASVHLTPH